MVAVALAACTSAPVIEPVIDLPTNASASAFPLDAITMEIAHEGSDVDLTSQDFTNGAALELADAPFAGDLVVHLTGRVGTQDVAYGRTCAFAVTQDGPTPSPHLYFSGSVKFGQLATAPEAQPELRVAGTAVTYHDGSGLLIGGVDSNNNAITDVERFDPQSGELALLTTVAPRIGAVAAPLGVASTASIALIGGTDVTTGSGATFVELITAENPSERRVQKIDDAQMARVGMTATALTDGDIIAIGGNPPPLGPPSDAVEDISISNGTAVVVTLRAQLAVPRTGHTATILGDDVGAAVLVAGGLDATKLPVAAAELYKPLSQNFSTTFTATMVVPRSQHKAVLMPDGSVLIIGGIDAAGNPVSTLELFTLDAGFVTIGQLPVGAGIVDFTATTLPDGRVLLTGGSIPPDPTPITTAFIAQLDPIDGSVNVVATDHLAMPRAGHQATLLCDGTVLVTGGTSDLEPAERYNPPPAGRR